jgi:nucleotide-binding universal stress UspA family protein
MDRILVALDGSKRAPAVLAAAVVLARRIGGKLHLFRGVGLPVELPHELLTTPPDQLGDELRRRALRDLDQLAREVPPELLDGISVRVGMPWQAVCEGADAHHADLIVIGSHGYGGLDRLLGTTAAKIVNHARCSVLVVKTPPAPSPADEGA